MNNDATFKYLILFELIVILIMVIIRLIIYLKRKHKTSKLVDTILNKINHKNITDDKYNECLDIIKKYKKEE